MSIAAPTSARGHAALGTCRRSGRANRSFAGLVTPPSSHNAAPDGPPFGRYQGWLGKVQGGTQGGTSWRRGPPKETMRSESTKEME